MKHRARVAGLLAAVAIAGGGCGLDFDRYEPDADRGPTSDAASGGSDASAADGALPADSGTGDDAPADAPASDGPSQCTPPAGCLMQAGSCGGTCNQQYQQCDSHCQSNGCKQGCKQQQSTCWLPCFNACNTCTQKAGCPAMNDCATAVQNGM